MQNYFGLILVRFRDVWTPSGNFRSAKNLLLCVSLYFVLKVRNMYTLVISCSCISTHHHRAVARLVDQAGAVSCCNICCAPLLQEVSIQMILSVWYIWTQVCVNSAVSAWVLDCVLPSFPSGIWSSCTLLTATVLSSIVNTVQHVRFIIRYFEIRDEGESDGLKPHNLQEVFKSLTNLSSFWNFKWF